MKVYEEQNVRLFKEETEGLLMKREAENNLPIGILNQLASRQSDSNPHLIYIKEKGRTTFLTMRTPPHLWILPSFATTTQKTIEALVDYLLDRSFDVPGVLGEEKAVEWFVAAYKRRKGTEPSLQMKQGIYKLEQLSSIPLQEGQFIQADQEHLTLAKAWFRQYGVEVKEKHIEEQADRLAEDMIEQGKLFLWVMNGTPVSMACRARQTPNGITINAVFTPDAYKRNGYATQVTYFLTEHLLSSGAAFCSLYTDLDNPSSNSIYQRIGYKRIGSSIVYKLQ
ncbi:GNAT family N-acetyltransferase [Halobacillus litoralis]|uniref:GNAT family N-acetyltransferase n=1 Tax=Halobacillus litoralis TaxID=45668 RepID=UPI001CD33058|nr:GNAT family N-acetyltransferase [Halobacillus litoralis]MCA0971117.1 GNAT family N-acetyltransferase [Halobacillus litoralis]